MLKRICVALSLLAGLIGQAPAEEMPPLATGQWSGTWSGTLREESKGVDMPFTAEISIEEQRITGSMTLEGPLAGVRRLNGSVNGDWCRFSATDENEGLFSIHGDCAPDGFAGTFTMENISGWYLGGGDFEATGLLTPVVDEPVPDEPPVSLDAGSWEGVLTGKIWTPFLEEDIAATLNMQVVDKSIAGTLELGPPLRGSWAAKGSVNGTDCRVEARQRSMRVIIFGFCSTQLFEGNFDVDGAPMRIGAGEFRLKGALAPATGPSDVAGPERPPAGSGHPPLTSYICWHTRFVALSDMFMNRQLTGSFTLLADGTYRWAENGPVGRYGVSGDRILWEGGMLAELEPKTSTWSDEAIRIEFPDGRRWNCLPTRP